jgi:flagellar biosynthesis anti-sigma factor FlgM
MKINDPNLSSLGSTGTAGTAGTAASRVNTGNRPPEAGTGQTSSNDDVHLSELVRSLRSLAADSPDRQTKIEALTRAYASGNYAVDSQATASAIISDAVKG